MESLRLLPLLLVACVLGGAVTVALLSSFPDRTLGVGLGIAGALALAAAAAWFGYVLRGRAAGRLRDIAAEIDGLGTRGGRLSEVRPDAERPVVTAVNRLTEIWENERRAAEADGRLLASLVAGSPNGVLVVDVGGRIRLMNHAFRTLFEVRGDPLGRQPAEVVSSPEVLDLLDLSSGQGPGDELFAAVGSRDVLVRSLVTEAGEVAILAQDVTRFRAAERARTAFVANVSHELRTPMAAILGYAEALDDMKEDLSTESRPLVQAILRNGRRLRDTFEGLMNLARVEARSGQLPLERLRLAPLLREAIAPALDEAARKSVTVNSICDEEVLATTNGEAFVVILRNLVANAVRYTPPGGRVAIVVEDHEHEVRVAVEDSGIGIETAHQERIFERFFRVDEGRARQVGGIGLGLAMVKHLCLATGARVAVHSVVGSGSTFIVTFPPAAAVQSGEGEE